MMMMMPFFGWREPGVLDVDDAAGNATLAKGQQHEQMNWTLLLGMVEPL